MTTTDAFKASIEEFLDDKAIADPVFMEQYSDKKKNLKDCSTYILNQVKKSGATGFADKEIFDMAIEYYTTKDIDIGSKVSGKVVINRTVELTDKEKEEAKEKAKDDLIREIKAKARKKPTTKKKATSKPKTEAKKEEEPKKPTPPPVQQPTLFG